MKALWSTHKFWTSLFVVVLGPNAIQLCMVDATVLTGTLHPVVRGLSWTPPQEEGTLLPLCRGCIAAAPVLARWIGLGPYTADTTTQWLLFILGNLFLPWLFGCKQDPCGKRRSSSGGLRKTGSLTKQIYLFFRLSHSLWPACEFTLICVTIPSIVREDLNRTLNIQNHGISQILW